MSTLYVDTINEKTSGNGIQIPGHVVQVQQFYEANNPSQSTTSASLVASGLKKTITPLYSNSLILVQASISMVYSTSWGRARMYVNGSPMPSASSYHLGYTDSNNNYAPYVCQAQYQATSTSALEFEVYVYAGGGTFYYTHGSSSSAITLWEIAQ